MTHIAINDFDMTAVTNMVNDAKAMGLSVNYDITNNIDGIVTVEMDNWHLKDGSLVIFKIHKIGKKRFLYTKISWIIQLYIKEKGAKLPIKKGCSSGRNQVEAIRNASIDVEHSFLSICNFDLAYSVT